MGAVFRCHNVLSPRLLAAVKVLKPHDLGGARERFIHEVELMASIRHPAVVKVLGGGEDPSRGLLYMVMELVEGEPLSARLARGPLQWAEACRLFEALGDGLLQAHKLGVTHRDIKPENIMICTDGSPRLLDFGVAVQEGAARYTQEGGVPGTLAYMAPEIFAGELPDQRADIYALGQVLWECLTGRSAFDTSGAASQSMARIVGAKLSSSPMDPGPPSPQALRELVQRATDPSPQSRLNSLDPFVSTLRATGEHRIPAPLPQAPSRLPKALLLGLVLTGLCAGGLGVGAVSLFVLLKPGAVISSGVQQGLGTPATDVIPDNFPFKLPKDAEVTFATRNEQDGRSSWTVMFTTGQTPKQAIDACRRDLSPRKLTLSDSHSVNTTTGDTFSLSGYNPSGEVASASAYQVSGGTQVTLFWSPAP